jgi:hypothetical protein
VKLNPPYEVVIQPGGSPNPQPTKHPLGVDVTVNDPSSAELDKIALEGDAANEHSVVFCVSVTLMGSLPEVRVIVAVRVGDDDELPATTNGMLNDDPDEVPEVIPGNVTHGTSAEILHWHPLVTPSTNIESVSPWARASL